jgi:hypothetical protein
MLILVLFCMISAYFSLNAYAYIFAVLSLIVLNNKEYRVPVPGVVFLAIVIFCYFFKTIEPNAHVLPRYIQVYFGFFVFYFSFAMWRGSVDFEKLATFLCCTVFIDALLINILPEGIYLANYPNFDGPMIDGHATNYFGFYQRPNGFASNASMTSTILAAMITMTNSKNIRVLLCISIIISASTTGILLMAVALILSSRSVILTSLAAIGVGVLIYILSLFIDEYFVHRLTPWYFFMILEYSFDQYLAELRPVTSSILLGSNYLIDGIPMYITDNGYAPFYYTNGIILTLGYVSVLFWRRTIVNRQSILILLIGAFHYPAIFTVPGQVFFALLLLDKFKNVVRKEPEVDKCQFRTPKSSAIR